MTFTFSPSINWRCPWAIALYRKVVNATAYTEETFLTPVRTPRVSYCPKLLAIFLTPSDDRYYMDSVQITRLIAVNSSSVGIKSFRYGYVTSNWSALVDFFLHVFFTINLAKLINLIHKVGVWHMTSLTWGAVSANIHCGARITPVVANGGVNWASFVSDFVIVHPLECGVCISSITAIVSLFARNNNLWRDVDIRPRCLTCYFYSIWKRWGRRMRPARATVSRDMLITDICQIVMREIGVTVRTSSDCAPFIICRKAIWRNQWFTDECRTTILTTNTTWLVVTDMNSFCLCCVHRK